MAWSPRCWPPARDCAACATRRAAALAATLNEIAAQSGVGMMLREKAIPVKPVVAAACELLGLDPLYVANEGKLIAICDARRRAAPGRGHARASAGRAGGRDRRGDRRRPPLRAARTPPSAAAASWTGWPATRCRASVDDTPCASCSSPTRTTASPSGWTPSCGPRGHETSIEYDIADVGDRRSRRAVPPRPHRRALPAARHSREHLVAPRVPHRAPGHRRRPRTVRARLGDRVAGARPGA